MNAAVFQIVTFRAGLWPEDFFVRHAACDLAPVEGADEHEDEVTVVSGLRCHQHGTIYVYSERHTAND